MDYIDRYERAPTYREIANDIGIAHSAAYHHVTMLYREGRIDVVDGLARSIRLLQQPPDPLHDLCWHVIDAWDDGDLGEAIRNLRRHLELVAPR